MSEIEGAKPPEKILDLISRGKARLDQRQYIISLNYEFWRGEQHVQLNTNNTITRAETRADVSGTGGKPGYKHRHVRNLIKPAVAKWVADLTQRIPGYEITPSNSTDPTIVAGARLAQKAAFYGYEQWGIRDVTGRVVRHGLIGGEGFAAPYFDNTVGRHIKDGVCEGEIKIRVLGPNEVFWEPGVRFDDSRWHCIYQARPVSEIKNNPKFLGGDIESDGSTSRYPGQQSAKGTNLVMVYEYFERPSLKNPEGSRMVIANGRLLFPADKYPYIGVNGDVVDQPVLHKWSFCESPDSDRDEGLVKDLIDPQRVFNTTGNRQLTWVDMALNPQLLVRNPHKISPLTDMPGAIITLVGNGDAQWRPVPNIPPELAQLKEDARRDLQLIAGDNDIPAQVESGKAIQSLLERDRSMKGDAAATLAKFHSSLMRHCLTLMQRHYSEPRLLRIRGRRGIETIQNFTGSDIADQIDVTVLPGSIEPRTRQAMQDKILLFADRGWITPQAAMAAINGGTSEQMIDDYELDVAWANRCIQAITDLYVAKIDQPLPQAREFDNHKVQMDVLQGWMKTSDYAQLPPEAQTAGLNLYKSHEQMLAVKRQYEAQLQQEQAEGQGMMNAAKPQGPKPMPDMPTTSLGN